MFRNVRNCTDDTTSLCGCQMSLGPKTVRRKGGPQASLKVT